MIGDVHLKAGDTVDRACWCADLGGEVGERRQVVAEQCACRSETIACELHAIARIASKADNDMRDLLGLAGLGFVGHDHSDTLPRLSQRKCYTTEGYNEADEREHAHTFAEQDGSLNRAQGRSEEEETAHPSCGFALE